MDEHGVVGLGGLKRVDLSLQFRGLVTGGVAIRARRVEVCLDRGELLLGGVATFGEAGCFGVRLSLGGLVGLAYPSPLPDGADDAAKALLSAANPMILAGQGVLYAEASAELVELAELLQAPVMTTVDGKSAFPEDHALALGSGGKTTEVSVKDMSVVTEFDRHKADVANVIPPQQAGRIAMAAGVASTDARLEAALEAA